MKLPVEIPTHVLAKIEVVGECWLWTGCLNSKGYPQLRVRDQIVYAHRYMFRLLVDPTFELQPGWWGIQLDHCACPYRNCVRPEHLEPVTQAEHTRRTVARRRLAALVAAA